MNKQNIYHDEINKFSDMAHQWWDVNGPCKPLHEINPLRLGFIQQQTSLVNKKVLDVGCGGGILAEAMAIQGAEVTGIDGSKELIEIAKLHLYDSNLAINYQNAIVEEFADMQNETFDIITCMELLEHVPDPASVIGACAQLLKPNGQLFFSTLNRNAKSYLFAIIGAEYILNLLPKGTHDYAHFIKPSEFASYARKAELTVKAMAGINYNPLSRTYRLSDNLDVNYLIYLQKP